MFLTNRKASSKTRKKNLVPEKSFRDISNICRMSPIESKKILRNKSRAKSKRFDSEKENYSDNSVLDMSFTDLHFEKLKQNSIDLDSIINSQDQAGFTPLFLAINFNLPLDSIELLLKNKANPNLSDASKFIIEQALSIPKEKKIMSQKHMDDKKINVQREWHLIPSYDVHPTYNYAT